MAIALMVAVLAGAHPALSAVRPAADLHLGTPAMLTPMPLDRGMTRRAIEDEAMAIPPHPAVDEAEVLAAEADENHTALLLALSAIGALAFVLVTMLVVGRPPRRGRTT